MNIVKCRTREPGSRPSNQVGIPGGAANGSPALMAPTNTVWHCLPFSEVRSTAIALFPELHLTTKEGRVIFNGDFGPAPDKGRAAKAKKQKS